MKKLIFIAAITVMAVSATQAQEVRLGAKAGVNFASIGGDNTDGFDGLTGFHLGALVGSSYRTLCGSTRGIVFSSGS